MSVVWGELPFALRRAQGERRSLVHIYKDELPFVLGLSKHDVILTCEDYETRQPFNLEIVDIEKSGARDWARYTAATLRFRQSAQHGRSFRWRAWGEGGDN